MPWFGRTWLDRLLGRGPEERAEPEAERAAVRSEEGGEAAPTPVSDLEEGATAAREETSARHEPFHPPGG